MAHKGNAITVSHVSKNFVLPHERVDTIKKSFINIFNRNRSAEVQHALRDINFEIKEGEFFGIVGRNGSGKSTLLKILAGIYQPSKGTVKINGRLVPFIELGVGFNGELTGRENVYLNGALLGFSKAEIDEMYDDIVEFAELEQFMDQRLKNYSSGMQVRLAFSLATRAKADVLLVDEVLAVGDADFQRKCFDYFRKLKKRKVTVVFVSHDMNAVREYCDRAILVEDSEIKLAGTAEEVAIQYARLFAPETVSTMDKNSDRWGDGKVKYTDIQVTTDSDKPEGEITIIAVAEAYEALETPVFGFSLANATGSIIMGTNTKIRHYKTKSMKPGDKVTIVWKFANFLNDGTYTVNPAISHLDSITTSDWWEGAVSFHVFRIDQTPYGISPYIEVQTEQAG